MQQDLLVVYFFDFWYIFT